MKCDVCDTRIPLGSHECPNCGYKMGKIYANSYDASSQSHEHIQAKTLKSQQRRMASKINLSHIPFALIRLIGIATLIIMIIIFVALISIPRYLGSAELSENSTYQELLDKGYDDALIQSAIADRDDLVQFFQNEVGIEKPDVREYSEKKDDITRLNTEVTGYFDDRVYSVRYIYATNANVQKSMYTMRDTKESIKTAEKFEGDQRIIDKIGEKIGVENLYRRLDEARLLLQPEPEDDQGRQSYYNDQGIYLTEDYFKDSDPAYYSYYFSMNPHH